MHLLHKPFYDFMAFVTFSVLWSFSTFFLLTYLTLVLSILIYLLPIISTNKNKQSNSLDRTNFSFVNAAEALPVLVTPYVLLILTITSWTAPATSAWFGHLVITGFQTKMFYLITFSFLLTLLVLVSTTYLSSREIYDYINVTVNMFYWVILLFMANSFLTVVFIIEVLSAALFLLVITSVFSTTYFYRNLNLSFGHMMQQSTPYTYLQSLLFFFWVSLISSLNLFLFCTLLYVKVLTLDWTLLEYVFIYFINSTTPKDIYTLGFTWCVLLFCIFLKCGLAPLYVWKPTFFKGLPIYTLFFYIAFFYFFLFIFIIHLLTSYFGEIFYFYSNLTTLFAMLGLVMLLGILCESFYLKAFLAMSSILNSLLVMLALSTPHLTDTLFWL